MSDELSDLEWAVELVRAVGKPHFTAGEAELAVAALAEPLRQSQKVPRLEKKLGMSYEQLLDEARQEVAQHEDQLERIEELEAALRAEHSLRAPHSRPFNGPCRVCVLVDTEANP